MTDTAPTADNAEKVTPTAEELAAVEPDPNAVAITINGRSVVARKGEYIIAAADRAGEYIPRFCYHERMESVGMCRMCLVEVDTGRGPAIQPSCMVTVAPDMKVFTESETTKRVQEGVLELLLANHPLDCPVCDKGGECPLQDQAFSHGPGESRFLEEKRHYEKPIPINELVLLDRERCILCDRCTRFADEVAGDPLIHFVQRGNQTQVLTFPDEPFSSYFSGNTVQICPVGALTAEPYRFKARPWDLSEDESTCAGCAVGCRISVQSTRDEVVRYLGVDSDAVNWGWLCDKGRFSFESLKSGDRLAKPLVKRDGELVETSWNSALQRVADAIRDTSKDRIALLGGARGTNEDAFAWAQLADAIGITHRDAQLADGLPAAVLGLPRATIDETTAAPTVVLLGPDPKEELGALYLRLRHVFQRRTSKLVELTPMATGLTHTAWRSVRVESGDTNAALAALQDETVSRQLAGGPVVIVAGRANLAESAGSAGSTLAAVYQYVAELSPDVKVLPALRRGNVVGALQLGLAPRAGGRDAEGILNAAANGNIDVLLLVGSDPRSDFPDRLLAAAIDKVPFVMALDTHLNASSGRADVVLPAAAFTEKRGTSTNLEGRVTKVAERVTVLGTARPDWMVAAELADLLDHDDLAVEIGSVDSITAAIARRVPAYAGATAAAVGAHRDGVLAVTGADPAALTTLGNVETVKRNNYDFRLVVSRKLYDDAVAVATSPSLAPLVGESGAFVNPADVSRIGVSDGGAVRLVGPGREAELTLRTSEAIPRGTVWVPWNRGGNAATGAIDAALAVTDVRIEAV